MSLKPTTHNLDFIARSILFGMLALLPILFTPKIFIGLEVVKLFVLYVGTGLSLLFWLLARLVDGVVKIPKSTLLLSLGTVVLAGLISTVASPVFHTSFIGNGFESMSFVTLTTCGVLAFMASLYIRTEKHVVILCGALCAEGFLLGAFQVVHVLIGLQHMSWVSLGYFYTAVANSVGSFNDLALFLGAALSIAMIAWEFLVLRPSHKLLLAGGMFLSTVVLALINFSFVWGLLGGLALLVFVFITMTNHTGVGNEKKIPLMPLVFVLISFLFVFESQFIGGFLARTTGVSFLDYRPSVSSTLSIARHSLWHSPIVGSGLNRFGYDWALYHPTTVFQSAFWDSAFSSGSGWLPTVAFSMGILGILAVLYFLGMYLYTIGKYGIPFEKEKKVAFSLLSISVLSLFFILSSIVYVPGVVLVALCFMSVGALVGVLVRQGIVGEIELSFLKDPRHSFFSILSFIVLFLGVSAGIFSTIEKFSAYVFFERGAKIYTAKGATPEAEAKFSRALFLNNSEEFSRSLTDFYLAKIKTILNTPGLSQDAIKSSFQALLTQAESTTTNALSINPKNYQNYLKAAGLYQSLVPLSVTGAYANANDAYVKALALNPNNPGIILGRATLELANKNTSGAKDYIAQALTIKPNYVEAYILRAQLESSLGDTDAAIVSAESAVQVDSTSAQAFMTLGLLRYNGGSYENAITAFSRAAALSSNSVEAFYYLGLAYDKAGKHEEALADFKALAKAFPNTPAFTTIVNNITAGNPALTGLTKDVPAVAPVVTTDTATDKNGTVPAKIAPVKKK
jgi:tetratricopeptide (TPR) repeat protein